jgi:hypothetical protein
VQRLLDLVQAAFQRPRQAAQAQPPPGQDLRRPGGHPGHPKHTRLAVLPELLSAPPHDYVPELCLNCGGLRPAGDEAGVVQQVEIDEVPHLVEEHRSHPGWCPHCCQVHYAPLPAAFDRGGLVGPRLTTLIAYLQGPCHASWSTVRNFLRDVVQITISRGQLANVLSTVSAALDGP